MQDRLQRIRAEKAEMAKNNQDGGGIRAGLEKKKEDSSKNLS